MADLYSSSISITRDGGNSSFTSVPERLCPATSVTITAFAYHRAEFYRHIYFARRETVPDILRAAAPDGIIEVHQRIPALTLRGQIEYHLAVGIIQCQGINLQSVVSFHLHGIMISHQSGKEILVADKYGAVYAGIDPVGVVEGVMPAVMESGDIGEIVVEGRAFELYAHAVVLIVNIGKNYLQILHVAYTVGGIREERKQIRIREMLLRSMTLL